MEVIRMKPREIAKRFLPSIVVDAIRWVKNKNGNKSLQQYLLGGRGTLSPGYGIYKRQLIMETLTNETLLERFRRNEALPPGYGVGVDERCIEYPWLLAHLSDKQERVWCLIVCTLRK